MNPQQMTNEQFSIWITTQIIHSDLFEKADQIYEWLENKQPKGKLNFYVDGKENLLAFLPVGEINKTTL